MIPNNRLSILFKKQGSIGQRNSSHKKKATQNVF